MLTHRCRGFSLLSLLLRSRSRCCFLFRRSRLRRSRGRGFRLSRSRLLRLRLRSCRSLRSRLRCLRIRGRLCRSGCLSGLRIGLRLRVCLGLRGSLGLSGSLGLLLGGLLLCSRLRPGRCTCLDSSRGPSRALVGPYQRCRHRRCAPPAQAT